ncbi:MAG: TRAP transporter substrate-binding protein DctP [Gammaproteobacteria bacterium]|nr:TRAP transporter substrate-binding protein DctP [Gammaproteobacteria bacterium]
MAKLILVSLALMITGLADAQQLKIATLAPEASEWMQALRAGAREIKQRTDSRVQFKIYGGGIQGSDTAVLRKMRIGALHGGAFTPIALNDVYADIDLYGMPLVFASEEEAAYVRERLDARLLEGLEEAGLVSFGFAATGFAKIMSNNPVHGVADLEGKKVWVPEGDQISYAAMQALKLSPQTLPLTDVLTGLQTELIDIIPVSPIGALVMQWHTKVKYITDMPLVYTVGLMVIDKRAFEKLQPGDQSIVREVMSRIYAEYDKKNLVDDEGAMQALVNAGIKRVIPDQQEIEEIREILTDTNRGFAENGDLSLDLYDEMLSYVAEYRSQNGQPGCGPQAEGTDETVC